MDQLGVTLRKLRSEADDCELISYLTGDVDDAWPFP